MPEKAKDGSAVRMHPTTYVATFMFGALIFNERIRTSLSSFHLVSRSHTHRWKAKPWYKPQSKGIGGLLDRLAVGLGVYEDMPGPKYRSEGYRLEEVVGLGLSALGCDRCSVFRC